MFTNVFTLSKYRTRKTALHPLSLTTVNKYNAKYPGDERRHVAAFKIAREHPNAPLAMTDLIARMKRIHFY